MSYPSAPFCLLLLLAVIHTSKWSSCDQWSSRDQRVVNHRHSVSGQAILCHRCTSAQPGCGLTDFNWRGLGFLGVSCPHEDDICVKIIERKGATETVTRDCLSTIRATGRTDIPADPYEGCRGAALDPHLGNYVNNSIKEYDIYRRHFDETTFCFCFFDFRCNGVSKSFSALSLVTVTAVSLFALIAH